LNINYLTSSIKYKILPLKFYQILGVEYPGIFILSNFYKNNRLNKGEYAKKNGIETRNIIRDSKNTTSSKH
jgi:hypothetical protein